MKRALILFLTLALLSSLLIGSLAADLSDKTDQVTFDHTLLYGDPTAGEGITLTQSLHYDRRLFWDLAIQMGREPRLETDFTSSSQQKDYEYSIFYAGLTMNAYPESWGDHRDIQNGTIGTSEYRSDSYTYPTQLMGLSLAYHEMYQEAQPGEEVEQTIHLSDYFQYYPLLIDITHPHFIGQWSWMLEHEYEKAASGEARESRLAVNNYFRIPVLEEETLDLRIGLMENGTLNHTGYSSTDSDRYEPWTKTANGEEGVYFSLSNRSYYGKKMDFSLVPGGYGIYYLPLPAHTEENVIYYDTSDHQPVGQVETILSLDEDLSVTGMKVSEDGTRLFLLLADSSSHWLYVLRLSDRTVLQKLELGSLTEGYNGWDIQTYLYEKDNALIAWLFGVEGYGDAYCPLLAQEDGTFEAAFLVPRTEPSEFLEEVGTLYSNDSALLAWDGTRLAVADWASHWETPYSSDCNFVLAVYEADGLAYMGLFETSLGISTANAAYNCEHWGQEPMTISFQP